jgi:hypothetical protein
MTPPRPRPSGPRPLHAAGLDGLAGLLGPACLVGLACLAGLASPAAAQTFAPAPAALATCALPERQVDRYQLLRRLSIDLRGRIPEVHEYEALDGAEGAEGAEGGGAQGGGAEGGVPAGTVRAFLADDGFRTQMRRYHEGFLWPNVGNLRISDAALVLSQRGPALALSTPARVQAFRGAADTTCADVEQTRFEEGFRPVVSPDAAGVRREGWRRVRPYWAPDTEVKVCAYDAQEAERAQLPDGRWVACGSREGWASGACGCGPGLRWCTTGAVDAQVRAAWREQLGRAVDAASTGAAPYTALLLSTGAEENGVLAFHRRHHAPLTAPADLYLANAPGEGAPADVPFTAAAWQAYERGGLHAGVLTLPGFLLRFQTQRARANRLSVAFACEAFTAPSGPAPTAGCSNSSEDLTQRCSCQGCHATLEPLASAWGRFAEAGSAQLDPSEYPARRPECVNSRDRACRRFYVTDRTDPAAGALLAYAYADAHPEVPGIVEAGPRRAAKDLIDSGAFARCTARRLFGHLMKREVRAEGPEADERELLETLARRFRESGYHLPALVESIVSLPAYRRVR